MPQRVRLKTIKNIWFTKPSAVKKVLKKLSIMKFNGVEISSPEVWVVIREFFSGKNAVYGTLHDLRKPLWDIIEKSQMNLPEDTIKWLRNNLKEEHKPSRAEVETELAKPEKEKWVRGKLFLSKTKTRKNGHPEIEDSEVCLSDVVFVAFVRQTIGPKKKAANRRIGETQLQVDMETAMSVLPIIFQNMSEEQRSQILGNQSE